MRIPATTTRSSPSPLSSSTRRGPRRPRRGWLRTAAGRRRRTASCRRATAGSAGTTRGAAALCSRSAEPSAGRGWRRDLERDPQSRRGRATFFHLVWTLVRLLLRQNDDVISDDDFRPPLAAHALRLSTGNSFDVFFVSLLISLFIFFCLRCSRC
jgi:hypothetical protein